MNIRCKNKACPLSVNGKCKSKYDVNLDATGKCSNFIKAKEWVTNFVKKYEVNAKKTARRICWASKRNLLDDLEVVAIIRLMSIAKKMYRIRNLISRKYKNIEAYIETCVSFAVKGELCASKSVDLEYNDEFMKASDLYNNDRPKASKEVVTITLSGIQIKINKSSLGIIEEHKWRICKLKCGAVYFITNNYNGNGTAYLHRLIASYYGYIGEKDRVYFGSNGYADLTHENITVIQDGEWQKVSIDGLKKHRKFKNLPSYIYLRKNNRYQVYSPIGDKRCVGTFGTLDEAIDAQYKKIKIAA